MHYMQASPGFFAIRQLCSDRPVKVAVRSGAGAWRLACATIFLARVATLLASEIGDLVVLDASQNIGEPGVGDAVAAGSDSTGADGAIITTENVGVFSAAPATAPGPSAAATICSSSARDQRRRR